MKRFWQMAAAVVSLVATALALYVQLFEARSRQDEARAAALRLEAALAESRSKLKAEILAELRADLAKGSKPAAGLEPIPGTVLRRPDPEESATGTLRPAWDPTLSARPATVSGVAQGLDELSRQTAEADRALRRDLEEFRAATRYQLDASAHATSLMLIALIPLVLHLLYSYWRERNEERGLPEAPSATPPPDEAPGGPSTARSARGS